MALLLLSAAAAAQSPVPALRARVTDLSATLSAEQAAALERKLQAFEARKGSQIAVLIVPSAQPETIEQFGIRVAEAWKLGRKGVDDGALLLIARDDRQLRIEVGYGLEGALSDIVSKRVIEAVILPRFKLGDFAGGIDAGVDAMIRVIDGEPLPELPPRTAVPAPRESLQQLLVIGCIAVFALGGALRATLGRLPAAALVGGGLGWIAWAMLASLGVSLILAAIAFLLTLFGGVAGPGVGSRGGPFGGLGGSGWGGSSGGFGGGGGGFGGGGASGRW